MPFEHAFRHTIAHFVRTRATQRRIAHQAQAERADVLRESEPRCDFAPLRIGLQRAHVAAVDERAALQQFAIAREHYSMFGQRKLLDFIVGKMIVVAGIETGQPKQVSERAKMCVGDKTQRLEPQRRAQRMRDFKRARHDAEWIDVDKIEMFDRRIKTCRHAIA